jgi:hypothetical protein
MQVSPAVTSHLFGGIPRIACIVASIEGLLSMAEFVQTVTQ